MAIPVEQVRPGLLARHHSGMVYVVLHIANASVPETDKFPHCVVYQNIQDKTIWTRPIKDWVQKFDAFYCRKGEDQ